MNDTIFHTIPETLESIERDTKNSGFTMPSERKTGYLLSILASAKPDGHFLELGTGTGLSTAWLLCGMNQSALLDSVDDDQTVLEIAQRHLDSDRRLTLHNCDGEDFIKQAQPDTYDLIFADAWPGKYSLLDETLELLKVGGFYVIDDMCPQPNWPAGHEDKAERLLGTLNRHSHLRMCRLVWATGIVICCRTSALSRGLPPTLSSRPFLPASHLLVNLFILLITGHSRILRFMRDSRMPILTQLM